MFILVALLFLGILTGILLRRFRNLTLIGKVLSTFIYLLLLFLGISVGKNEAIMSNMATLGIQALIITLGAMLGSVVLAKIVYNRFFATQSKLEE